MIIKKLQNPNFRDYWLWGAFLIYVALTLLGVLHHEPWCDEAQAWLIARDLNFGELLKQMPYEGTPALWHLLNWLLIKLGLPILAQGLLHWLIAGSLIFVFLFFSPLPKIFKFIFTFSYYPLYEYAVIARNYNLSLLFLFLIAALYPERFKKPLLYSIIITLLFQTNLLSFVPALILAFLFIIDYSQEINNKKIIPATIILTLAAVSALLQIIPYYGQLHSGLMSPKFSVFFSSLGALLIPRNQAFGEIYFYGPWSYLIGGGALIILGYLLFSLVRKKIPLFLYAASAAWLVYLFLFKVDGGLRHYGFFLIFLIFSWWLNYYYQTEPPTALKLTNRPRFSFLLNKKIAVYIFGLALIPGIIMAAVTYWQDYHYNFSGGQEMAAYLKNTGLDKKAIASFSSFVNISLLPYLPNKMFWQPEREAYGTFVTLDAKYVEGSRILYPEIKRRILAFFPNRDFLILSCLPLEKIDSDLVLLGANQTPTMSGGSFYLYKLKNN